MNPAMPATSHAPTSGCVVQCRSHRWLVEEVALGLHSKAGKQAARAGRPGGRDWGRSQRADGVGGMNSQAVTTAPTPADLLSLLRSHRESWEKRFHLRRIGLFGSTARNEATAASDVDVWVELDPLTPFATVHLKQELETLLQRPVDLVRLRERMNPALRQAILREGISA
jgi:predicted nucleotidyltransferase